MKREVEYSVRLSARARYRHRHAREKGKVIYFSIQLETMIEGEWYPIVRYNTAHGFAHRDLLSRKGETITKTPIFVRDYNDALAFAESDLKANWMIYRERFLRGRADAKEREGNDGEKYRTQCGIQSLSF